MRTLRLQILVEMNTFLLTNEQSTGLACLLFVMRKSNWRFTLSLPVQSIQIGMTKAGSNFCGPSISSWGWLNGKYQDRAVTQSD